MHAACGSGGEPDRQAVVSRPNTTFLRDRSANVSGRGLAPWLGAATSSDAPAHDSRARAEWGRGPESVPGSKPSASACAKRATSCECARDIGEPPLLERAGSYGKTRAAQNARFTGDHGRRVWRDLFAMGNVPSVGIGDHYGVRTSAASSRGRAVFAGVEEHRAPVHQVYSRERESTSLSWPPSRAGGRKGSARPDFRPAWRTSPSRVAHRAETSRAARKVADPVSPRRRQNAARRRHGEL